MKQISHISKIIAFSCLLGPLTLILSGPECSAQTAPRDPGSITVTGRVSIEQRGKSDRLILHATDAAAYLIQGDLAGQLRHIAQKKPGINLVTVTGIAAGNSSLSCDRTNTPAITPAAVKELRTEIRCFRYMHLDVRAILSVAESAQPMPPMQRDAAAEAKMASGASGQNPAPPDIGEIYGTITDCNFRAAVKTIDIQNSDAESPLRSITVLITAETKIVRRIGAAEPQSLTPDSLQTGQRVTVVYSKNDIRTNAMFITVTKE
jgi:hypothetical protein